jgi:hypothetical protein
MFDSFPIQTQTGNIIHILTGYRLDKDGEGGTVITITGAGFRTDNGQTGRVAAPFDVSFYADGEEYNPARFEIDNNAVSYFFNTSEDPERIEISENKTDELIIAFDTADIPERAGDDVPSAWAEEIVDRAAQAGLLPSHMLGNYRGDVTGPQIMSMLSGLLDVTGINFDEGVVTREGMAIILNDILRDMDVEEKPADASFADAEDIDPEAAEAVSYVCGLELMGSLGDGRFGPDEPLTVEQAIIIFDKTLNMLYDMGIWEGSPRFISVRLIGYLKERRYAEIQPLLMHNFDFEGDDVVISDYYDLYIDMSELAVTEDREEDGGVEVSIGFIRPDLDKMERDYYNIDYESRPFSGVDEYIMDIFENGELPMHEGSYDLLFLETDGGWKILFDCGPFYLITGAYSSPYAEPSFLYLLSLQKERYQREEALYLDYNDYITVEEDGEYINLINNGDKTVTHISLKMEYFDRNEALKRTAYNSNATKPLWIVEVLGQKDMIDPGHMRALKKSDLFHGYVGDERLDAGDYGADLASSKVSVFDAATEDYLTWAVLPEDKQLFCDKFLEISGVELEDEINSHLPTPYFGYGIDGLNIANSSEMSVTSLAILLEFTDEEGIVRYGKALRIISADEEPLAPGGVWELGSDSFFRFDYFPPELDRDGNMTITVIDIEYE